MRSHKGAKPLLFPLFLAMLAHDMSVAQCAARVGGGCRSPRQQRVSKPASAEGVEARVG